LMSWFRLESRGLTSTPLHACLLPIANPPDHFPTFANHPKDDARVKAHMN
jgi:hypothetical protein